jgi:tetratricopeptide (TPR) repeat protein
LSAIAQGQAQSGKIREAILTSESIEDERSKRQAKLSIAEAQAKAGDLKTAEKSFEQWLQPMPLETPLSKRERVLAEVAAAQLQAGDSRGALQTGSGIEDVHLKAIVFAEIAAAQAGKSDGEAAQESLRKAVNLLSSAQENGFASYHITVAQARMGQIGDALRTAHAIHIEEWQAKAFVTLSVIQAERGDVVAAKDTLNEMPKRARQSRTTEDPYRLEALLGIARVQTNSGDPQGALSTLKELTSSDFPPDIPLEIAYAKAVDGQYSEARTIAAKVIPSVHDTRGETFRIIAAIQAKKEGVDPVLAWASKEEDPANRALALLGIADGLLGDAKLENQELFYH